MSKVISTEGPPEGGATPAQVIKRMKAIGADLTVIVESKGDGICIIYNGLSAQLMEFARQIAPLADKFRAEADPRGFDARVDVPVNAIWDYMRSTNTGKLGGADWTSEKKPSGLIVSVNEGSAAIRPLIQSVLGVDVEDGSGRDPVFVSGHELSIVDFFKMAIENGDELAGIQALNGATLFLILGDGDAAKEFKELSEKILSKYELSGHPGIGSKAGEPLSIVVDKLKEAGGKIATANLTYDGTAIALIVVPELRSEVEPLLRLIQRRAD